MHAVDDINDKDIAYAERLLLPPGKKFDAERRMFIRRMDTLDLHAVPGSGKTTALLAKLLIVDRSMPFRDGSGILVLSHTNAAVNELRNRLESNCVNVFNYPNFIGTIQSFVDQFLAIPFFVQKSGRRPLRIGNELYGEAAAAFSSTFLRGFKADDQTRAKYFLRSLECSASYRFRREGANLRLINGINGGDLRIAKPRPNTRNYQDWSSVQKSDVERWLITFKRQIMARGILCFDDAYFLAEDYVGQNPGVVEVLRERFRYVFVDEMQDMAPHQHNILESLFSMHTGSNQGYQRIGDINQSIHDGSSSGFECHWSPRSAALAFSNSCRLSSRIANVVEPFALQRDDGFKIVGMGSSAIAPKLLVFSDDCVDLVIPEFASCIKRAFENNELPPLEDCVFKAVGWNTTWSDGAEETRHGKRRLIDYWPHFKKTSASISDEYPDLKSCLACVNMAEESSRPALDAIMKSIVKVLHVEEVTNPSTNTVFTQKTLWAYLREHSPADYEWLRNSVYKWVVGLHQGYYDLVQSELAAALPHILSWFGKALRLSAKFVAETDGYVVGQSSGPSKRDNFVTFHGFDIEIASVHKVKGQTHTATLYLETAFQTDGKGASAKSYESQRLASQFLGNSLVGNEGKRVKQSAKMVYVGLSRPTHLLCVAVHEAHFNQYLAGVENAGWNVVRVLNDRAAFDE